MWRFPILIWDKSNVFWSIMVKTCQFAFPGFHKSWTDNFSRELSRFNTNSDRRRRHRRRRRRQRRPIPGAVVAPDKERREKKNFWRKLSPVTKRRNNFYLVAAAAKEKKYQQSFSCLRFEMKQILKSWRENARRCLRGTTGATGTTPEGADGMETCSPTTTPIGVTSFFTW